ncbi:MAG: hypothetical protein ACOZJX_15540 [Pseudomonadota bacterium]
MNTRTRLLAALSLTLVAAGCGMFSSSSGSSRLPTPDAAGSSLVVLYHVHLGDADTSFTDHNVYLDGTRVGRVNAGEELRLQVGPGISELSIQPATRWLGSAQGEPLKYSIETPKGPSAPIRYMRYRTAVGQARMVPVAGTVLADRELGPVTELDYNARN